jgi:hypothetical protein
MTMRRIEINPMLAKLAGLACADPDRENLCRVHIEINDCDQLQQMAAVTDGARMVVCDSGVFIDDCDADTVNKPAAKGFPIVENILPKNRTRINPGEVADLNSEAQLLVNPRLLGEVLIAIADVLEKRRGLPTAVVVCVPVLRNTPMRVLSALEKPDVTALIMSMYEDTKR